MNFIGYIRGSKEKKKVDMNWLEVEDYFYIYFGGKYEEINCKWKKKVNNTSGLFFFFLNNSII